MKQTLRTTGTQYRYEESMREARKRGYKRCYLCSAKIIKEFAGWKIVENEYPYDRMADTHHMVTLKRHTAEAALTPHEKMEYERDIKPYLHRNYDMIFENTVRAKSIPGHHHLHMITLKQPVSKPRQKSQQKEMSLPLGTLQK